MDAERLDEEGVKEKTESKTPPMRAWAAERRAELVKTQGGTGVSPTRVTQAPAGDSSVVYVARLRSETSRWMEKVAMSPSAISFVKVPYVPYLNPMILCGIPAQCVCLRFADEEN